jgi:hypothetical protein
MKKTLGLILSIAAIIISLSLMLYRALNKSSSVEGYSNVPLSDQDRDKLAEGSGDSLYFITLEEEKASLHFC